ncbi:hypothetical protein DFH08DRAFT_1073669 [Mycena albidolilacea]|uniref:DUF6534 domain-containing protein n=1 Tax=Mycena albidolilacea TaxID=1033008 RepID=A0AAD7AM19_9AGAR|nr:hypothetical protein DFH08DRAFT_1073669 [Mycena albidolilacea]
MSAPPIPVDRTFILTFGFQFIAYSLDVALWGIAMVMVLQYFRKYARKDPVGIQIVVGILGVVTTNHIIFSAMLNFKDVILLYGNLEAENTIFYEANVMLCSVYVVEFTAQIFYASRIWILTKRDWRYTAPVVLLALCQFVAGLVQTVEVAKVHLYTKLQAATGPISSTQSGATLACDLTITAILCYVLRKSRSGIRRTDSAVDRMIIFALNRGAMTSIWALLQLIFFVGMPGTFVFMMFILPSSQLYVISVCSMLISRESLRADLRRPNVNGISNSFPMTNTASSGSRSNDTETLTMGNGSVHIATSVVKWVDDIPDDDNAYQNGGDSKRTLQQGIV